jgi:hypothetical protein
MTLRRTLLLGALASVVLLATGSGARADYGYSTLPSPLSQPFGTASSLAYSGSLSNGFPGSLPLTGSTNINILNIQNNTSKTSPTDSGVVPFSLTITISQVGGQSNTGIISGTLNFTRNDLGGSQSTAGTISAPDIIVGNIRYVFSSPTPGQPFGYAQPTVNGAAPGDGNISLTITPTAIPEPASLVLMGSGLVGVLGLGLRRMKKA